MNILVTGGCGYVGTVLTNRLLEQGHSVTVFDTQWFGNFLSPHPHLKIVQGDVRHIDEIPFKGQDVLMHLANIANDPTVELHPTLSWEVNVLAAQHITERSIEAGIKQIIFASSGSVYGVKEEPDVTEDLSLTPISVYNKTKMIAERVFLSYKDQIQVHCVRPATVCGLSPRMRLDVSVNMLTMQALTKGKITVFGGDQVRPNIHMGDMIRVYEHFLAHPELPSGCYNAGFENISIMEIARRIEKKIGAEIVVEASNDPRSYRQNSDKLCATGFQPAHNIDDAIDEITKAYKSGQLVESDMNYNMRRMKQLSF
jgi:nucleoside-diphosphate-sugar epimerase